MSKLKLGWVLALALSACATKPIVADEPPLPKQEVAKETPDQELRTAITKALPGSYLLVRNQKHPCCVVPQKDGTFLFRNEWGGESTFKLHNRNPLRLIQVEAGQWGNLGATIYVAPDGIKIAWDNSDDWVSPRK